MKVTVSTEKHNHLTFEVETHMDGISLGRLFQILRDSDSPYIYSSGSDVEGTSASVTIDPQILLGLVLNKR